MIDRLFVRRVHVGTVGLRVAGRLVGELRAWHGAVAIRFDGLALQESHFRTPRGRVLGAAGLLQFATARGILSHTGDAHTARTYYNRHLPPSRTIDEQKRFPPSH